MSRASASLIACPSACPPCSSSVAQGETDEVVALKEGFLAVLRLRSVSQSALG